jgi:Raf kinase inhibitor-like YbhB/YbcL family protein
MSTANKDGVTVSANAPRRGIYHWVLVDIPADRTHLSPGDGKVFAEVFGVPRGNAHGEGLLFYEGGYGGPCPPWNDMKPHHYRIRVYALDVPTLGLSGAFTGSHAELMMKGHLLAQGDATASYATNAALGTNYQ